MEEKIYPVNFDIDIEFIVGPNLQVPVTPVLVEAKKIIGFDFIKPRKDLKSIMFDPTPVVLESNGLYFPTRDTDYWKPDLSGAEASHIFCQLIKPDIDESSRQKVISVVNYIHGNRTLIDKKKLFEQVENNEILQERIRAVYGIDGNLFHPEKGISSLLGANGYAKSPQARRTRTMAKKKTPDETFDGAKGTPAKSHPDTNSNDLASCDPIKPHQSDRSSHPGGKSEIDNYIPESMEYLKSQWDEFAISRKIPKFNDIIASFQDKYRQDAANYLCYLITTKGLIAAWEETATAIQEDV